jgi:putative ABC transport system permease protein
MRARRGIRFTEDNNFFLNTSEMLISAYKQITGGIFIAMVAIASMALIVGGIGIMNIMLVSVTERTREIGVRKAVGATPKDIMLLFLIEAILLTTIGGLIGVVLGFIFGKVVSLLTPIPASIPLWSVIVGLGFSSAVGLFFGIYPARKASKLNPVEALRYE